jgi:hypothetical protein
MQIGTKAINEAISGYFGRQASVERINSRAHRLYVPFFHEDGDMFSIYIESDANSLVLRDYGNTVMRVSYTFDLDTRNKQNVLRNIVTRNDGEFDDGELIMHTNVDELAEAIFRYGQIISKVSNIDILSRETVRTLFYDYLAEFVSTNLTKYDVKEKTTPLSDRELIVDYEIPNVKPLYIFGVNNNAKASRVVISCLQFQQKKIPFRSIVVHENFEDLSRFNRGQITNAADKQFTTLEEFKGHGVELIERELAS